MPVARVQRPTEPAGETALPPLLELNYISFSPSRASEGAYIVSVKAREGVSERRWRSAANRPKRELRPGGGLKRAYLLGGEAGASQNLP